MSAATELTVALKISFDHCAGRRSGSASAFRPDAHDRGRRPPRRARTASPRTGPARSRCRGCTRPRVSECFVPRHERDGGDDRPVAVRADDLLRAEPVERRHQRARRGSGPRATRRPPRGRRAFVATMPRSNGSSSSGSRGGRDVGVEVAAPGDPQAVAVQRVGVLPAPREHARRRRPGRDGPRRGSRSTPAPITQTRSITRPARRRPATATAGAASPRTRRAPGS